MLTYLTLLQVQYTCSMIAHKQANECPSVQINNGGINSSTTKYDVGAAVRFSCNIGYEMVGNIIINCVRNGQEVMWNGDPPKCYNKGISLVIHLLVVGIQYASQFLTGVFATTKLATTVLVFSTKQNESHLSIILGITCIISLVLLIGAVIFISILW